MSLSSFSRLAMAILLPLSSCESAFDPTAPAGSTPYVICVINPKDTAQYVRIQRSYICQENAFNYSSNSDSLYYPDNQIEVFLTRFDTLDGSMMEAPIRLFRTDEIPKDSGAFSSQGHYLFKTTATIHPEFEYELSIMFPLENKTITSRIHPLGSWNLDHAFKREQRKQKYSFYHPERINYFMDLTPNRHPQLTRFLYIELTPSGEEKKYIEYYHNYHTFNSLDDNFEGQDFLGDDFLLRLIQREIPVKPKVRRIAVGVDFMIQLADSNLILYQTVEDPGSKFMYTPEFNNIRNGGVGLFASRFKLTIFGKALKPSELDSLSMGKYTRLLNFADSRGKFHDGK